MQDLDVSGKPYGYAHVSKDKAHTLSTGGGLLDVMPVAAFTCDADGALVRSNARCAALWGHSLAPGDRAPLTGDDQPVGRALRAGAPVADAEVSFDRPDGQRWTVLASAEPLFDGFGRLIGAVGCFQDITDRKSSELRQREMLHELNHRVKNTLSTVQSLAVNSLRGAGLERQAREAFEDRLMALSRAHEQLCQGDWMTVDLAALVDGVLAPFGPDRAHSQGRPVALSPRIALDLSLALHELTANAAQHGALSTPDGRVGLTWTVTADRAGRRLTLEWTESGGPPVTPPLRRGFGRRLLERGVGGQTDGQAGLSFEPEGVRCRMDIPLPIA